MRLREKMTSKISQLLHPKDFSAALRPYSYSSIVFGQCNAGSKKWQAVYAVFVTVTHFALSLTVTYDHARIVTSEGSAGGHAFIIFTYLIVNTIISPIHIWTWFFVGQKYYKDTVSSLTIIDQELVQTPHCRLNFSAMVTRQIVCLALLIILYVIIVLGYSYAVMEASEFDFGKICRMCAVWYPSTIRVASCCAFGNMVVFIGERYALLNRALKFIVSPDPVKSELGDRANVVANQILIMQKLRIIHAKLFLASRRIMHAFELQVLTCFLASLICGIVDLNQLYRQTLTCKIPLHRFLNCVIQTVNDFGPIVYVAYNCHKTMQKGNEATQIINSVIICDEKSHLEISTFSHQLMHYRLRFSPFGLFQLDINSLQNMIATMSLYLIIFIQLEPSSVEQKCTND